MPARTINRTNVRNRRALDPSVPPKATPAIISSIDATAADTIQITFSTRVFRNRLPKFTAGAGGAESVASAAEISDTVIELTFTGDVQGTDMSVPEGDPGIRSPAAGFVPAGTYAIPSFP
jgi:hypothetical protein